jgi:NAD-dependent deacetylase
LSTQNIDDLHERAGTQGVVHLHGSLMTPKCFVCHRAAALNSVEQSISDEGEVVEPPSCSNCSGQLRPGVVWFGEDLPTEAWKAAVQEALHCDVMLSIGTPGVVMPVASLPDLALAAGAFVIHINTIDVCMDEPEEMMLIGDAGHVLPALLERALAI